MHRIDGAGHVGNRWVAEDLAANRPPTEITAEWMNDVQENLAAAIEKSGIPLQKGNSNQLFEAIHLLSGQVVDSIADLRGVQGVNGRVFVLGYYARGDGGGGAYFCDSADTASADNGGTVIVSDDGRRWKIASQSTVNVNQFGAYSDGSHPTETTAAMKRAVAWLKATPHLRALEFNGKYQINSVVDIKGSFGFGLDIIGNKSFIESIHNGIALDIDTTAPDPAPGFKGRISINQISLYGPGKVMGQSVGVRAHGAAIYTDGLVVDNYARPILGTGLLISAFHNSDIMGSGLGVTLEFADPFACNDVLFVKTNITGCDRAIKAADFPYGALTIIGSEIESINVNG
jgi:hypothetical protein